MIYNLVSYLSSQLSNYNYVVNGWQQGTPDNALMVSESNGDAADWIDRNDFFVQIMSRSQNKTVAKKQLQDTYNILQKKFGLTLPSVTIGSDNYPEVKTWKIVALQLPGFIGNDENGRALFSVNFNITTN